MEIRHPLVLGIHWAHDASAALCSSGGVHCVIQEERLNRIKHYYGFPCNAIEKVMEVCGVTPSDIDAMAFSTKSVFYPEHNKYSIVDEYGFCTDGNPCFDKSELKAIRFKTQMKVRKDWGAFADRHYSMMLEYLFDSGFLNDRIKHYYIAHHRAHASSVFRSAGLDNACIITVDGKGDGLGATVYRGLENGELKLVRATKTPDSIGLFYQAVTEALGFVPVDSEYKTMGLAAYNTPDAGTNPFNGTVSVHDGIFRSIPWTFRNYNDANPEKKVPNPLSSVSEAEMFKKLLGKYSKEKISYYAQEHLETNMLNYAADAMEITDCISLLGAGGVMLNVKCNARIRDDLKPDLFSVFPDAGDSGLAAGAAMEALFQMGIKKLPVLNSPYLGNSYKNEDIEKQILKYADNGGFQISCYTPELVAKKVSEGKVIGTFQGRMEMGPRALGNRSVLADPRSEKIKDRINLLLKGREWFVPFAPAVISEDAEMYWNGATDYKYMTFAVKAGIYAAKNVPAVVHVDGTMRPQVVSADTNPWLHRLLMEFKKQTGVGVMINTSFNRHGEPIVCHPEDALRHISNRWIDGLAIGDKYIELKQKDTHV